MSSPAASTTPPSTTSTFAPVPTQRHTDYTTRYRCVDLDNDYVLHTHGNGICIVALAPTHPIRREEKAVVDIAWHGSSSTSNDRLVTIQKKGAVTGKRKKGGIILEPHAVLCHVRCADGSTYQLLTCVHGKLIEINSALTSQPSLLTQSTPENWLALFSLTPKCKPLLSVEDRALEGSEEERDTPEGRKVKRGYQPVVGTDAAASSSTSFSDNHHRPPAEYLKPSEYEKKRAEFFE